MFPTPRLLASITDQLDTIEMHDQDTKGAPEKKKDSPSPESPI